VEIVHIWENNDWNENVVVR